MATNENFPETQHYFFQMMVLFKAQTSSVKAIYMCLCRSYFLTAMKTKDKANRTGITARLTLALPFNSPMENAYHNSCFWMIWVKSNRNQVKLI